MKTLTDAEECLKAVADYDAAWHQYRLINIRHFCIILVAFSRQLINN